MSSSTASRQKSSQVKDRVSADEWNLRVDLAACYRLAAHFDWNDYIFNHISVRIPGPERHFLINPFGLLFEEITASSLIRIDQQGKIIDDDTGLGYNQGGFVIHGAVHEARDDAHCVIHVHPLDGVAVSVLRDGLLPLHQEVLGVIPDLAYHAFEGIALDMDERKRLIANLGQKNHMILRNHGLLTCGPSVAAAFTRMYVLQRACSIQSRILASGQAIEPPSEAATQRVFTQMAARRGGNSHFANLAWRAFIRKLDRADPSYRE